MQIRIVHFLLVIFLLASSAEAMSQDRCPVQVSGFITNDSLETLPFVHILIKKTRYGTISSTDGFYSLVAREGDTLIFSCIGYKKKRVVIPASSSEFMIWKDVNMVRDTIMLKEATVLSWATYRNFLNDVATTETPEEPVMKQARENIEKLQALIHSDYLEGNYGASPGVNYRYTMSQFNYQSSTRGTMPTYSIFNPFAWASFFKALQNGEIFGD